MNCAPFCLSAIIKLRY